MTREEFKEIQAAMDWTNETTAKRIGKHIKTVEKYRGGKPIPETVAILMRGFRW